MTQAPPPPHEAVERLTYILSLVDDGPALWTHGSRQSTSVSYNDLRTVLSHLRQVEEREAALIEESAALTKALTGLTRGGSEYFIRKGDRYVADIPACVAYVRDVREMLHRVAADARREVNAPRTALTHSPETDGEG